MHGVKRGGGDGHCLETEQPFPAWKSGLLGGADAPIMISPAVTGLLGHVALVDLLEMEMSNGVFPGHQRLGRRACGLGC